MSKRNRIGARSAREALVANFLLAGCEHPAVAPKPAEPGNADPVEEEKVPVEEEKKDPVEKKKSKAKERKDRWKLKQAPREEEKDTLEEKKRTEVVSY